MKKKLEAELISIAHRILKLKNKSELDQLHQEAQKLYEKLSVLKFVEENFADIKPTIGKNEAQEILETAFGDAPETTATPAGTETVAPETEKPSEDKPQTPEKDPEPENQPEQPEIEEPETPEKEKVETVEKPEVTADATPLEKEVDEVIADAENEIAAETPAEEMAAENEGETEEIVSEEQTEEAQEKESEIPVAETPGANETAEQTPILEESIQFEEPETKEEVAAAIADTAEIKSEEFFKPTFEWAFEAKENEAPEAETPKSGQIAFEDLLGKGYVDPVFVKPDELKHENVSYTADELPQADDLPARAADQDVISISRMADKVPVFKISNNDIADKTVSLNDRLSKGITVGLNDRIAFVKNLFNNSNEDYNRVLSQLITFDTFRDAQDFIDNMVKPDYNNWEGKDEYAQRFMEVIEKKFS